MRTLQESIGGEYGAYPKILLMEDEVNVARGLKMVLNEEGYEVDVATTGQSALDQFHQKTFDLLVADLRLPDMDGMEVIKQVREGASGTKVVVITGQPSVATAVESMKSGVFDYLPKPFTEEEFKTAIESALRTIRPKAGTETAPWFVQPEAGDLIQKREVLMVLNRATDDRGFWHDLVEARSETLEDYDLSSEAKAAILYGDLMWLNEHVGGLTQKQLLFIHRRLEREAW
jgi:DNA-binding response OmpR family regulator